MDNPLPDAPTTYAGQVAAGVVWAAAAIGGVWYGLRRLFQEEKRAGNIAPDDRLVLEGVDLTNTSLIRKELKTVIGLAEARDQRIEELARKAEEILVIAREIRQEQEVERRVTDRELLHHRRPPRGT